MLEHIDYLSNVWTCNNEFGFFSCDIWYAIDFCIDRDFTFTLLEYCREF